MIHNIRTGFGDSVKSYEGNKIPDQYQQLLMGVNQENRAGPTFWEILSSTLFTILREQVYGTQSTTFIVRFSYVDNCDQQNTHILHSRILIIHCGTGKTW